MDLNRLFASASIAAALVVASAAAQAQTVRVVGAIIGVDGPTIVVKQAKG